jgi:hypothetical protein
MRISAYVDEFLLDWLLDALVQKLVLVIASVETKEVLERWVFDLHTEKPTGDQKVLCVKIQIRV